MIKNILLLSLVLFLSACAVTIKTPLNRFDSPEAEGEFPSFRAETGLKAVSKITLANTDDSQAINNYPNSFDVGYNVALAGSAGIIDRLNVELKLNPSVLQFKYQFLGETRKSSNAGNFSLAATAGFGYSNREKTQQGGLLSFQGVSENKFEIHTLLGDSSIIAGYRFHPMFLLYAGPSYTYQDYKVDHTRTNTNGTVDLFTENGHINQWAFHLGGEVDFEKTLDFRVEFVVGSYRSPGFSETPVGLGAVGSIHF